MSNNTDKIARVKIGTFNKETQRVENPTDYWFYLEDYKDEYSFRQAIEDDFGEDFGFWDFENIPSKLIDNRSIMPQVWKFIKHPNSELYTKIADEHGYNDVKGVDSFMLDYVKGMFGQYITDADIVQSVVENIQQNDSYGFPDALYISDFIQYLKDNGDDAEITELITDDIDETIPTFYTGIQTAISEFWYYNASAYSYEDDDYEDDGYNNNDAENDPLFSESIMYNGKTINVFYDDNVDNPFTTWDGLYPLMYESNYSSVDYSDGDITDALIDSLGYQSVLDNFDVIANMVDFWDFVDNDSFEEMYESDDDKYNELYEYLKPYLDESIANKENFATTFNINHISTTVRGNSQGDWADVFVCWTPEFGKVTGVTESAVTEEDMMGTVNIFSDWMFVNTFRIEYVDADGNFENMGSIFSSELAETIEEAKSNM